MWAGAMLFKPKHLSTSKAPDLLQVTAYHSLPQLWRGMQQSVRPADGGLSFNVDVAHATVYEQMPIPVLLTHVLGVPETDLGRLSPAQHLKIRRLLECRQVSISSVPVFESEKNQKKSLRSKANDQDGECCTT